MKAKIYNEPKIIHLNQLKPMSDFYKTNIEHAEKFYVESNQVVFLYNDTKEEYDIAGWV